MEKLVILYSKPVQGCLIHTYPDISSIGLAVEHAKKFCDEYSCSARIMEVKVEVGKNGVIEDINQGDLCTCNPFFIGTGTCIVCGGKYHPF